MKIYKTFSKEAVRILKTGGVGVLPTDTLYGIVACAMDKKAVERVYKLRRRTPSKPVIVLISSSADLKKFGIIPGAYAKKFLAQYWPGKISVVLPLLRQGFGGQACRRKFSYLHRGTNSLALRVPAGAKIRAFLKQTGPLVAPSANTEGKPPAKTIAEAKKYFGERIDFYIDAGKKDSRPSTLVRILKNKTVVLREGAVKTC